jgi:hypothetical protein
MAPSMRPLQALTLLLIPCRPGQMQHMALQTSLNQRQRTNTAITSTLLTTQLLAAQFC